MGEWRRRPWRKIRATFATSIKLRRVGPHALALLAAMTSNAWWDDEAPEGRMYESDGVPLPMDDVFALAQLTPVQGRAAWAKLAEKKVVDVIDGVATLVRYRKSQRSDSAERTRAWRERHTDVRERHGDGHGDVPRTLDVTDCRVKSAEEEPPKPPRGGKPKRGKSEPKPIDPRVEVVLATIDRERIRHTLKPLPPSERHERPILTRLEDGISVDDLCLAVELHSRDQGGAGRLTAATPFTGPSGRGPGGWSWSRRLLDEHAARPQSHANSQRFDTTPASQRRELEERAAEIAREESAT
jgi:hypothetical protein